MAGNFFTGLNDQLNVNDKQRNQDDSIDMLRQRQRMADVNSAIQNERADEEMGIKRESAIRTNRDADFAYAQREQARKDAEAHHKELSAFDSPTGYWAPRPVNGPDGKPAIKADGTPETYTPDPANMGDRIDFYKGVAGIARKYAKTGPEMMKFFDAENAVEQAGNTNLLRGLYKRDPNSQAAVGKMLGFSGPATLIEGRDSDNLPTFTFSGKDENGKPVGVDFTQGLFAIGANPNADLQTAKRGEAIKGAAVRNQTTIANARETSAEAAETRANRPARGPADSDGDGVPDKVETSMTKRINSIATAAAKDDDFSDSFMVSGPPGLEKPKDAFKQSKLVGFSTKIAEGKKDLPDAEVLLAAKEKYASIERAAIAGRKYVKDGDGYRLAMPEEKGAKDFRSLPMSQWKIQERNKLFDDEFARQQSAYRKPQAIPTK